FAREMARSISSADCASIRRRIRATFGASSLPAQASSGPRKRSGRASKTVSAEGSGTNHAPRECSLDRMLIDRAPRVLVSLSATEEMEFMYSFLQCLFDGVTQQHRARAEKGKPRIKTADIGVGASTSAKAVVNARDLAADPQRKEPGDFAIDQFRKCAAVESLDTFTSQHANLAPLRPACRMQ